MRVQHNRVIAEIDTLPGSSQVAVVHGVFTPPGLRGYGMGKRAQQERLEALANDFMYDAAICTVDMKNSRNIHILEKNGWKFAGCFKSRKTEHDVGIYIRGLGQTIKTIKPPKEPLMSGYAHIEQMGGDWG